MKPSTTIIARFFLTILFFTIVHFAKAQDIQQLIDEGIALHDKGEYVNAIKKYDEVLKLDAANCTALYEKSYSLMALKKYDESEKLVKQVLDDCKDADNRRMAFVNYGTLLDYKGDAKGALKIYEKGIKEFPDSYLLYFNKGITQGSKGDNEEAIKSYQKAIQLNPFHASSHNALARMEVGKSRVKAMIGLFTFLLIEPEGARAKQNLQLFDKLFMQGINQKDEKNTVISIDAALLDPKRKTKEDDFSSLELILSFLGADNKTPDTLGFNTDGERLSYKMQLFFNGLSTTTKDSKGFYTNFYVPFLTEMKEKDFVTTACYIALASAEKDETFLWLDQNKEKVKTFNEWFEQYKWYKE
ncbi:MAG: tetratricopeptide repeat protein [Agriterribacter sp.]